MISSIQLATAAYATLRLFERAFSVSVCRRQAAAAPFPALSGDISRADSNRAAVSH